MAKKDEPKTDAREEAEVPDGLIEVVNSDGNKLRVHPTTVRDHVKAGWKVSGE